MVKVKNKGNFDDFKNFLNKAKKIIKYGNIEVVINNCVKRLEDATPKDTGLTSKSWFYEIERNKKNIIVSIYNKNIQNGVNIALILDFGHATSSGVWIEGLDYIEPVVYNSYLEIINETWKDLTKL